MKNYSILFTGLFISVAIPLAAAVIESERTQKYNASNAAEIDSDNTALALIHSKCFVCHNPDMKAETRLAPPMHMVREHYYTDEISRAEFVDQITSFVLNPTLEKSVMLGAVRNFALMPKPVIDEVEVRVIAEYIFDNDLASDSWYKKWKKFKQTLE